MNDRHTILLLLVAAGWLAFLSPAATAVTPCCSVTGISADGLVTARDTGSNRVFQFRVNDKALLSSLHVGQAIHADFATQKVSVDGISPCCGIVSGTAAAATSTAAQPANPCCNITGIAGDLVTARETGSNRVFQFRVNDKALLSSLHIGQAIHADFGTQKVSVDGAVPCCTIVSGTAPTAMSTAVQPIGPCCNIVANAGLTGRLGRLVIAFPEGANASGAHVVVSKDEKDLANAYGNQSLDLLAGTYVVSVNNMRVDGVTIQAGHDTQLKVGVLRVSAADATRVRVLAADQTHELTSTYGKQELGFPVGTVYVEVAGQREAVTITEGKITNF